MARYITKFTLGEVAYHIRHSTWVKAGTIVEIRFELLNIRDISGPYRIRYDVLGGDEEVRGYTENDLKNQEEYDEWILDNNTNSAYYE